MRSLKEIEQKIELMDSSNWPEGEAAVELLKQYHSQYDGIDLLYMLGELDIRIKEAYQKIKSGEVLIGEVVRVNIAVWMMGDQEFVAELLQMPYEPPHLNKIKAMAKRYSIRLEGE